MEIVNPAIHPAWNTLLHAHGRASFFHSVCWAKVLGESYGYKPCYFTVIKGGNLVCLLPFMEVDSWLTGKRGVSLPFTDYCEPIMSGGCIAGDVMAQVMRFGKGSGWRYIEFRGGMGMPAWAPSAFYYKHVLDISRDDKTVFSSFRESTRRNVKKAEREGVKVTINSTLDSISRFYHLNCLTRKLHGLPPQPHLFFEKIHEHIVSKGHGMVALAHYNGTAMAGGVYFHFGDEAIYKYGALDKRFPHLRANYLVMWEAIRYYAMRGFRRLSLGRTDPEDRGLLQFKRGWRGQEQTVNYYRYDLRRQSHVTEPGRIHGARSRIFANMPVPVLRLTGSMLYRHIG